MGGERKVWFIPTDSDTSVRGYLSKKFFFDIRKDMIHNPGGYCLICKEMKLGVVKLFSRDMYSAKMEALTFLKRAAVDPKYHRNLFDFINKYSI